MIAHHDAPLLGAYVLGTLPDHETRQVQAHIAGCQPCQVELESLREMTQMLGEIPAEALLEGPPEDGDLLLQRTLRQVRAESNRTVRRRRVRSGLAAAAIVAIVLSGGFAVGRTTAPNILVQSTSPTVPPGTVLATATDPMTGVGVSAQVKPAAGWVRISAKVTGVAQGEKCRLLIVDRDGVFHDAGSWLVSEAGEHDGTALDGSVLVALTDVAAVEVHTVAGRQLVSASL